MAGREPLGGYLEQEPFEQRGGGVALGKPRWKRPMARRRMRSVPVKLIRSGSSPAMVAASKIVRRMARCASARP